MIEILTGRKFHMEAQQITGLKSDLMVLVLWMKMSRSFLREKETQDSYSSSEFKGQNCLKKLGRSPWKYLKMKQEERKMYVDWPSIKLMLSWPVTSDTNLIAQLYILKMRKVKDVNFDSHTVGQ